MNDQEALLKPREVAKWLGVHVNTIKRMSDRGEIPYYRIGTRGDRRYDPIDVSLYLTRRGSHGSNGTNARPERSDARDSVEGRRTS